jgi:endonuclease I
MKSNPRVVAAAVIAASACLTSARIAHAQYDAPATYYNSATGTGATLKSQLRTTISAMTGIDYGDARYSAIYTDADPTTAGNIILMYNRASVVSTWDPDNRTSLWNREHIWPQSRLGASAENGTTNIASDQFNLRPADPDVNNNHSNLPFGDDASTGSYGPRGSLWYPGDVDQGDAARAMFYMATRYSQLSLIEVGSTDPTGTTTGDLSSLVRWHYRDVPDTFERRRNHAIYGNAGVNSPAITNPYKQQNRNPFVDRPEYVWSVYMDQANDMRLSFGTPAANGGSTATVNLGRVLVNAPVPSAQTVTLTENGDDGTYYSVTTSGSATSSVTGRYNAFAMLENGSRAINVGLNTTTTAAGLKSGAVTVDNLDITTAGGAGRGANDANDTVNVSLDVLSHANGSFSSTSDVNTLNLNFGTLARGTGLQTLPFDIANLLGVAGFTSGLELDSSPATGNSSVLSADLSSFGANIAGGSAATFNAILDTAIIGNYTTSYTINLSDENLPGALSNTLFLNLSGIVSLPKGIWVGGAGNWSNSALWGENLVPNDSTFNVKLDDGNTAAASVATLDQNATVGSITQDAGDTLNINATRILTIVGTSASNLAGVVNNSGEIKIQAGTTTLTGGGTHTGKFNVAVGATLDFAGGAHTLAPGAGTLPGGGVVKLSAGPVGVAGNLHIGNGSTFEQTGGTLTATNLLVGTASSQGTFRSTGGTLNVGDISVISGRVVWDNPQTLSVNTVTTTIGTFDLTSRAMVIKGSNLAAVTALISEGYNNGDWLGEGIASSAAAIDPNFLTAIGFASNADAAYTEFEGISGLDGDDVLLKFTYYGDADLTGSVDLDDFNLFLAGYQDPANVSQTWIYGDFDYTGSVNLDDFNLFLAAYQANGVPLSALAGAIDLSNLSATDQSLMLAAVAAVPEPAGFTVLTLAAGVVLLRRKRVTA